VRLQGVAKIIVTCGIHGIVGPGRAVSGLTAALELGTHLRLWGGGDKGCETELAVDRSVQPTLAADF
jgi:hypothetical protein